MAYYENKSCPACNKQFTAQDDIVTCPHCGTPHHRECYNALGHCFNADKHNTDFSYTPTVREAVEAQNSESARSYVNDTENRGKQVSIDIYFGRPIDKEFAESTEEIDGKSVKDIATAIGRGAAAFIPKFRSAKPGWSWPGFIFGPYYLFYRKMYKEGFIFLALRLIAQIVAMGLYAEGYAKYSDTANALMMAISNKNVTDELINSFQQASVAVKPMLIIVVASVIIIHVILGFIANKLYRKSIIRLITRVDEKVKKETMLENSMPLGFADNSEDMSEENVRRLYLSKLGSTTIFAPLMAYCIFSTIINLITK